MANYVKSTNFAVKDGLPSGDPLKVVKGTEIDTEFNNIATSVASKANISSPTFLGTPFAPTASPGTATNQLATTAFVAAARTAILEAIYPVGSIYTNATNSTNPGTLLGFGTWVAFGAGRVPVGFNSGDANFNAAEKTGGSKDATVVSHTHTFSATTGSAGAHAHGVSDPGHAHGIAYSGNLLYSGGGGNPNTFWGGGINQGTAAAVTGISIQSAGAHTHSVSGTTSGVSSDHTHSVSVSGTTASTGSSGTNANLQPYITVFMWKRVS